MILNQLDASTTYFLFFVSCDTYSTFIPNQLNSLRQNICYVQHLYIEFLFSDAAVELHEA